MIVVRQFLKSLVEKYGKHTLYSDGDICYPETYKILKMKHYMHSPLGRKV
jgi:putative transposase